MLDICESAVVQLSIWHIDYSCKSKFTPWVHQQLQVRQEYVDNKYLNKGKQLSIITVQLNTSLRTSESPYRVKACTLNQ